MPTHSIQRLVSRGTGGCVPEMVADRAQRDSHAGYAEVQRPARLLVDRGSDRPRAAQGGIAVPVVTKVPVSLQQRQDDSRSAAVEGLVDIVVARNSRPRQAGVGITRHVKKPVHCPRGQRLRNLTSWHAQLLHLSFISGHVELTTQACACLVPVAVAHRSKLCSGEDSCLGPKLTKDR